jgi:phosphoenolpyruvate carboxykinase (GTP)
VVPLVTEARDWRHGTFLGSIISSEKTAAAAGKVGELRRDPMAMLPFCGYNMADYWSHWLSIGRRKGAKLPRIFYVNWFRKDDQGKFLWPGFGENSRVLSWVFQRCTGQAAGHETPIGTLPAAGDLELSGLDLSDDAISTLLSIDHEGWLAELPLIREYYAQFGNKLPTEFSEELDGLERRLRKDAA